MKGGLIFWAERLLIYCANKEDCLGQEGAFFRFSFHVFGIKVLLLA